MRICFFNQYGQGDASPTARLLQDLAEELSGHGWEVQWITDGVAYKRRKSGLGRWLAEAAVHFKLLVKGLFAPRPQIILSLTSPACLVVTAALVGKLRGARHVHWAMDLYPDLALALGEVRDGAAARFLKKVMKTAYGSCSRVVALDEDMRLYLLRHYGTDSLIIQPWPASGIFDRDTEPDRENGWEWLYSGNLGRAHEWRTLLDVQALLEKEQHPARLIFQGDGAELMKVKEAIPALGLRQCILRDYVPAEQLGNSLLAASILIATRKPGICGLLWPSKLALLQELPRPLLWVGDTDGHTASQLKTRENTGVFRPGENEEIKEWLLKVAGKPHSRGFEKFNTDVLQQRGREQWRLLLNEEAKEPEGLASGKKVR